MKSHSLLRTNVALTTNVKLVVTASYSLYLDSIDSTAELNDTKLKKFGITKDSSLEFALPTFWKNLPAESAYSIKYDGDVDLMYTDFSKQYDGIYNCGARNISNNKDYTEEFEYFAPLHISKNYLPTHFIIFRIDGPGLLKLTRNNFKTEILDNMKCVKVFDLTKKTDIGQFLDKNITRNVDFPNYSADIGFDKLYSSISGVKYPLKSTDAGYTSQSFALNLTNELSFYDIQKTLTNSFKKNGVIYPHIINFNFLFDDTPATPTSLRKWSLNRYMGFYFDKLELVSTVSPTILPALKNDIVISKDNVLESMSGGSPFTDGADLSEENMFIQIGGVIYKIRECPDCNSYTTEKTKTNSNSSEDTNVRQKIVRYKIYSDTSLFGKSVTPEAVTNQIIINYENGENKITNNDGTPFTIGDFDNADVWLIQIGDDYFKLTKNANGFICITSDYAFKQTSSKLEYYINDPDTKYRKSLSIILKDTSEPLKLYIYKAKFTDIKDFDNDIIETEFSKFEYEKDSQLTNTDESKLYVNNLKTNSLDDFKFGSDVVYVPVSSEYTANNETFRVANVNTTPVLTDLWRKNPFFVKWGYKNSICINDYPYYLNNSLLADPFNRTTNFIDNTPNRIEKNLDYFYSINSDSPDYTHHSLHIEDQTGGVINQNFKFELDKYLGMSYSLDYFTYFFGKRNEFLNGKIVKNIKKWSYFNGDDSTNSTVFKGLKFLMKKVDKVTTASDVITSNTQAFTDYKFSILLSNNEHSVTPDPGNLNKAQVNKTKNTLRWNVVEEWKSGKTYATSSIVMWNDMLFVSSKKNSVTAPSNPGNSSTNWDFYTEVDTIYWYPTITNNLSNLSGFEPIVYNDGQYYYKDTGTINFWNPRKTYSLYTNTVTEDNFVFFKSKYYKSIVNNNTYSPVDTRYWQVFTTSNSAQRAIYDSRRIWKPVKEWSSSKSYASSLSSSFNSVTYNNTVYGTIRTISANTTNPSNDPKWTRIHSFNQDTNTIYGPSASQNNLVRLNNEIYLCKDNTRPTDTGGYTIDNSLNDGVNIYINKKFKNILLNIYVNDNTFTDAVRELNEWVFYNDKISNVNRDELYKKLLYKFTASNIFTMLYSPNKSQEFSDKIRYVIINEDSSINIYDFNNQESCKNLPFILHPHYSNKVLVKQKQIKFSPVDVNQNILKPTKYLLDGLISTKKTLNYYSDLSISNTLEYPSVNSTTSTVLYRHNGYYVPIFKEIQLFKSNTLSQSFDNYKFDTDLTDFGMSGEMVVSKVNRSGSVLKLKDSTKVRSIYPMLDEFGYHVVKRFIFKSNWDYGYHFECVLPFNADPLNDERTLTINKSNIE